MQFTRKEIGIHLLRLGLAVVFLWFGFSQILDSLHWVSLVPEWVSNLAHLPPAMIVLANGAFEIVLGTLLAMGFFVRTTSLILALHLIPIALGFGLVATSIRDFAIIISCLALSLVYNYRVDKS